MVALYFLFILIIAFPQHLLLGKTFFFGDNFHLLVPLKIFLTQQLKQGIFPFWNPYILSGTPFFADINNAVFYPSTLLFLMLDPAIALTSTIIFHLFLAGFGMYFLAIHVKTSRVWAFFAGIIFMLSQPLLMASSNIALLQTISWMPVIVLLTILWFRDGNKKALWLLPLVVSLSFLGGHPQPLVYLFLVLIPYALYSFRSNSASLYWTLAAGIVTFAMLAVTIIPFFELYSLSTRSSMPISEVGHDSVNPAHFIDFVIPNFFSNPAEGMSWGIYWNAERKAGTFITWAGLLSLGYWLFKAKKSKEEIWFSYASFGILGLSMGTNLPGFESLLALPLMSSLRNYSLMLVIWPLMVSPLLAKSIPYFLEHIKGRWKTGILMMVISVVLFSLVMVQPIWFVRAWNALVGVVPLSSAFHTFERDFVILNLVLRSLIISAGVFGIVVILNKFRRYSIFTLIVVGLILLEYVRASAGPLTFSGREDLYLVAPSEQLEWLAMNSASDTRIVSSNEMVPYTGLADYWSQMMVRSPFADSLYHGDEVETNKVLIERKKNLAVNWNVVYNVPSPFGFSTFVLQNYADYWKVKEQTTNINEVDMPHWSDYRYQEIGTKYIFWDQQHIRVNEPIPAEIAGVPQVYEGVDFSVFEIPEAKEKIRFADNVGSVLQLESTVNEIGMMVERDSPGTLLLMYSYYPGWNCKYLDLNQECTITPTENGFMSVDYSGGSSEIVFAFWPRHFYRLGLISLMSWVGYLGALAIVSLKHRQGVSLLSKN